MSPTLPITLEPPIRKSEQSTFKNIPQEMTVSEALLAFLRLGILKIRWLAQALMGISALVPITAKPAVTQAGG
jgi:hypothetical protein